MKRAAEIFLAAALLALAVLGLLVFCVIRIFSRDKPEGWYEP